MRTSKQKRVAKPQKYFMKGDGATFNVNTPILRSKLGMQTFTMSFLFQGAEIIPAVGAVTYGGISFSIASVPNITNWTINFDKFRLNWVEIVYSPSRTQMNGGSNKVPIFYCAPDFDSDATPTSVAEVLRKPRSMSIPMTSAFRRKFIPRIARTVYRTGVTSSYSEGEASPWIDCSNADTPHFGYSFAADAQTAASQFGYAVSFEYNVTFAAPIA